MATADETYLATARILIVDDQVVNVQVLTGVLQRMGCANVRSTTDGRGVVALYKVWQPDLILLDLHMPHVDGFAVLDQLKGVAPAEEYLPVLVLTADITAEAKQRALLLGAKDFLSKPFDVTEAQLRIRNLLQTRWLHRQLQEQNQRLEARVRERTAALAQAQREILQRLARAAEYRDDVTGEHTQRVGTLAALLAQALGLPAVEVALIREAAPLHDVGKIGIADQILLKPGKLTPEEYTIMQSHTTIGAALLAGADSALAQLAEQIALTHHERWDGGGYPQGLANERIPLVGRLVAIADVFDALTHVRPYKSAWSVEEAVAEISRQGGKQFDPEGVAAFLTLPHHMLV